MRENYLHLLFLLSAWPTVIQLVDGLRNAHKSTQVCLPAEQFADETQGIQLQHKNCAKFCRERYQGDQPKLQSYYLDRARGCCCTYQELWPKFLKPNLIGRDHDEHLKFKSSGCLPLIVTVRLSSATKLSFKKICDYLVKSEPLTMIEVLDFAKTAALINYLQPKHPTIRHLLSKRRVKKLDSKAEEELEKAVRSEFMEPIKPLEQYDGYKLETNKIHHMHSLMRGILRDALSSSVVARAFDEYLISYIILDISAAWLYIDRVNHEQLRLSDNPSVPITKQACGHLHDIKVKLNRYLETIQRILSNLFEKGLDEKMRMNYVDYRELLRAQELYHQHNKIHCDQLKN